MAKEYLQIYEKDALKHLMIDDGIKELISLMNNLEWIQTTSSCEGHQGDEYHYSFYVQFFCRAVMIDALSNILNRMDKRLDEEVLPAALECSLAYHDTVGGGQADAPRGFIALYLRYEFFGDVEEEDETRKRFLEILTEEFRLINKTCTCGGALYPWAAVMGKKEIYKNLYQCSICGKDYVLREKEYEFIPKAEFKSMLESNGRQS